MIGEVRDSRNLLEDDSGSQRTQPRARVCTPGKKGQKTRSPSFTRSIMLSAGGSRPSDDDDARQTERRRRPSWNPLLLLVMGSN